MHGFKHQHHNEPGEAPAQATNGLILKGGWRYDLHGWFFDACLFCGMGRALRQRAATVARLQPGALVLDVGCGTGTLAIEIKRRVGSDGQVFGIDPGTEQIARARAKAARHHLPIAFQVGAIEQLAFPDQMFDVVFSTLMMHHLPARLKAQGLAEIDRVLKPGGRLIVADFARKQERTGLATRFHAGGSSLPELAALVVGAGFVQVYTEELPPPRFSMFPGAGLVMACKNADAASR